MRKIRACQMTKYGWMFFLVRKQTMTNIFKLDKKMKKGSKILFRNFNNNKKTILQTFPDLKFLKIFFANYTNK